MLEVNNAAAGLPSIDQVQSYEALPRSFQSTMGQTLGQECSTRLKLRRSAVPSRLSGAADEQLDVVVGVDLLVLGDHVAHQVP